MTPSRHACERSKAESPWFLRLDSSAQHLCDGGLSSLSEGADRGIYQSRCHAPQLANLSFSLVSYTVVSLANRGNSHQIRATAHQKGETLLLLLSEHLLLQHRRMAVIRLPACSPIAPHMEGFLGTKVLTQDQTALAEIVCQSLCHSGASLWEWAVWDMYQPSILGFCYLPCFR